MKKEFFLTKAEGEGGYRGHILKIINDVEKHVRMVRRSDSFGLSQVVEHRSEMDMTGEAKEYEMIRQDVCESFGVLMDERHVKIVEFKGKVMQRVQRAFDVVINTEKAEGFYAEGRTGHHDLLEAISELAEAAGYPNAMEDIIDTLMTDTNTPKWLFFKGFVNKENFSDLPESVKKNLEQSIVDNDGKEVKTPSNWILTGHNLSDYNKKK
ncbi:MAG: hypothetical protein V1707_01340 [bacterium]